VEFKAMQPFVGLGVIFGRAFHRGLNMNFRALAPFAAICTLGIAMSTTAASAAELAIPPSHHHHSHRAAAVRTDYVFWDDVYPPAIYGPYLRPVEEAVALKAAARPVDQHWRGYWYIR
jgi:hypothetical protein